MISETQFYKEENFKVVEADGFKFEVPEDWEVVRLGEMAEKVIDSPHKMPKRTSKGYPFVSVNYVLQFSDYNFYIDPNRNGLEYIPEEDYEEFKKRFDAEKGDIIYTKWGTPGVAKLINTSEKFIGSCSVALIKLKKDAIIPLYLVYSLNSQTIKSQIIPYSHTSTRTEIHIGHIKKIKIPLPPLQEQQKIAHVLMSIDKAIEAVDEAIKQAERIKKGLMQELLTKGMGHKEFKDTEIGRIPKEWEVVRLESVIREAKPGFASGKRDENGILQLRMDSIETNGRINPNAGVKVPIPKNVQDYLLKPGDILFNNTNSVELIGKTALYRGEFEKCVFSNHLTRIRVDKSKILPEWLLYVFIRFWQLRVFRALCNPHVHQAGIKLKELLRLKIPLPSLSEQQKIAEILSKWDEVIELKKAKKERLERMKKKAMDLLLTGKIRVK